MPFRAESLSPPPLLSFWFVPPIAEVELEVCVLPERVMVVTKTLCVCVQRSALWGSRVDQCPSRTETDLVDCSLDDELSLLLLLDDEEESGSDEDDEDEEGSEAPPVSDEDEDEEEGSSG